MHASNFLHIYYQDAKHKGDISENTEQLYLFKKYFMYSSDHAQIMV